jgi:hypothetical protein
MRAVARIRTEEAEGTAFPVRQRGNEVLFVTNAHVVEGYSNVVVITKDGAKQPGVVLAHDDDVDLAIVSVKNLSMSLLGLGDSDALQVGDQLYVVGYPLGSTLQGDPTVTKGIVSGRRLFNNINYIQTDAAINPGNSGGPVINVNGQVVGIASMGFDPSVAQGINFAIPSKVVRDDFDRLLTASAATPVPRADGWELTSATNAPRGRALQSSVWTGTEVIIWGGFSRSGALRTGARYNPVTGTWTPLPIQGAPSARIFNAAVWTGSEMIVWGGLSTDRNGAFLDDGARYTPSTNTWSPLPKAPLAPRMLPTAIWTGTEMIVWAGLGGASTSSSQVYGDGARFNPARNTWTTFNTPETVAARVEHSAIWTGQVMIVYGGGTVINGQSALTLGDCWQYSPATNAWTRIPTVGGPGPRELQSAIWTGQEMIIWGGARDGRVLGDGARLNPATRTWSPLPTDGAPTARQDAGAVWTGKEMLIWGGRIVGVTNGPTVGGARYDPTTNVWAPVPQGPLSFRTGHTAMWTGTDLFVFGGLRFDPTSDKAGTFGVYADGARYKIPSG